MDLIFVTNARLTKDEDGRIFSINSSFTRHSFESYLKVFSTVYLLARVEKVRNKCYNDDVRLDSERIKILELPYYIGPVQYLKNRSMIKSLIRDYIQQKEAAIICRVPGTLSTVAAEVVYQLRQAYGVEVVADPSDIFAPGSFKHPFRLFFRIRGVFQLKKVVSRASSALYVTRESLQRRYPVKMNTFSVSASDVMLPPEAFAAKAKTLEHKPRYTIVTIGSLAQMYKSPDVLLNSLSVLQSLQKDVRLVWVGDGQYKQRMLALAKDLGILNKVDFVGTIKPASAVREYLDKADIFVLPSRTEGLPRALVEAMARGLPCICTNVGGMPELIDARGLVPVNDCKALANRILELLENPSLTNKLANRNLHEARNYELVFLANERVKFFDSVKRLTEKRINDNE